MATDVLEPVTLGALAEALHDGTWLDMRVVDMGTLQRVLVQQVNIYRTRDEIVLTQKWPCGEEVGTTTVTVDAEDVRWLRETQVALPDVTPIPVVTPPRTLPAKRVVDEIIRTVAFLTVDVTEADLRAGRASGCAAVRPRQEAMWLAYEMTDLAPDEITRNCFGYASAMPMVTIRHKLEYALRKNEPVHHKEEAGPTAWFDRVRGVRDLIDSNLGARPRRSSDRPWPKVL